MIKISHTELNILNDNLFELLSCILAEGLYRQILVNKKQGLINLKEIMKHEFLNDMPPDFSFINLDYISEIYFNIEFTIISIMKFYIVE